MSEKSKTKKSYRTQTPYHLDSISFNQEGSNLGAHIWDEIAKGIAQKMPDQLIPVINEAFHTSYQPDAEIEFLSTEYAVHKKKEGHPFSLVLSDITFRINGGKVYHIEFQVDEDNNIILRMVEYDFQIGLQHDASLSDDGTELHVTLPHSVVIIPNAGKKYHDGIRCTISFPDGSSHTHKIPVINISSYKLSELFEKRLNMFLPFSFFRFRSRLEGLGKCDPEKRETKEKNIRNTLTAFLDELILGLKEEVEQGIITNWQCSEYIRLTEIALGRILNNYPSFKEVQTSMTECKLKFISDYVEEYKEIIASQKEEISRQAEENAKQAEENAKQAEEITRQAEENARQAEEIARLRRLLEIS